MSIASQRDYFSGRQYQVYRVPPNASLDGLVPDGASADEPLYYIAHLTEPPALPFNPEACSVFSASSALLDYPRDHGFAPGGHPRFSRLGWVLGGEFAMCESPRAAPNA